MQRWIKKYTSDDDGAVTADWVVISGFAIAMALSVATALSPALEQQGTEILSSVSISTTF